MVPKGIRGRGIQRKGHPRRISGGAGCKAERLARGERRAGARRRNPDGRGCRTMAAVQVLRPSFFYGRPVRRVASTSLSVVYFSALDICAIILGLVPSTFAWRYSRTFMVGHCVRRLSTASCPFCRGRMDAVMSSVHSEADAVLADVNTGELIGDQPPQNRNGVREYRHLFVNAQLVRMHLLGDDGEAPLAALFAHARPWQPESYLPPER